MIVDLRMIIATAIMGIFRGCSYNGRCIEVHRVVGTWRLLAYDRAYLRLVGTRLKPHAGYQQYTQYWYFKSAQIGLFLLWTKFCSAFLRVKVIDNPECFRSCDHAVERLGNDMFCALGISKCRRSTVYLVLVQVYRSTWRSLVGTQLGGRT
jgi:hypothetical protein